MQPARRWIAGWVATFVLVSLVVGAFNFVVDPYGLYRWFDAPGINQQKEGVRTKIRHTKALELPLRQPATVLLGSSRVHDGLNPALPVLQEYPPVYNSAVEMCRIHEALAYLRHAVVNSHIKRVILGLDFFMFDAAEKTNPSFEPDLVGRRVRVTDYLWTTLLSRTALVDSLETLRVSRQQPQRREFLPNGFRPGSQVFYKVVDYPALHYLTNWTFLSSQPHATKYYADMHLDEAVFADFESFLRLCAQQHLDCRLYINPAHASLDGEGIRAAGLWGEMETWKRRITHIAQAHGVPLWDFSGYNSVTTEPVVTPMHYYWDSSHFTVRVGGWILDRVMGAMGAEQIPADFGIRLTDENVEAHLAAERAQRDNWVRAHPQKAAALARSFASYLKGEPLDVTRTEHMFAN